MTRKVGLTFQKIKVKRMSTEFIMIPDKYETWFMDPKFSGLNTWYVMNNVIQMNAGKFSNLHDSILLYLDPDFSTDTAVQYILGRFDPES